MAAPHVITGQKVDPAKLERAKALRRRMTAAEQVLWQHFRRSRSGGYHFRRQQVIGGFIVDFYRHSAGLAVEVDGEVHEGQREYDVQRDQILCAHGVRFLRIPNAEVEHNLPGVLALIERHLTAPPPLAPLPFREGVGG